ncbi:MAG: helix-turn-helix domain-containing protein [Alphaproteobacteria bacterium]|nr:helix-turn-helix domain-containing protein [Alphaproteobacteria bacterium]
MVEKPFIAGRKRSEHPDPVDVHVGARLRLRRNLSGLSQEQLGKASGLTFQQIQKYERGVNRMGASRLFQLARLLDVPVAYFFEDMPSAPLASAYGPGMGESTQQTLEGQPQGETELLHRRETLELIRAYYRITDPKQRRKIYELIKSMAEQD